MKKILRQKGGFTLIELLISIVLFTVFLSIVSQSYLSIVRSQKQANDVRKMYSELRVFMDSFAEEVRLSAIDYNCYSAETDMSFNADELCDVESRGTIAGGRTNVLSLVKKGGGEKTTYLIEEGVDEGTVRIKIKKWYGTAGGGWAVIPGYEDFRDVFSERILLKYASFAVFPDVNPYSSQHYADNAAQFQPKVTLFLNARNEAGDFDYQFQTSISSRVYTKEI